MCKNHTCVEKRTSEIYIRYVCILRAVKNTRLYFFIDVCIFVTCCFSTASVFFCKNVCIFLHDVCIFWDPGNKYIRFLCNVIKNTYVLEKNTYVFKKNTPVIFSTTGVFFQNVCIFSVMYVFFVDKKLHTGTSCLA